MQLHLFPEYNEPVDFTSKEYHECPLCFEVKHKSQYYIQNRYASTWLRVSEGCKPCYTEKENLKKALHKQAPPKPEHCECCGRNFKEYGIKAELDHCHTKKVFKGWLCAKCNGGLGRFNDDIELLHKAIVYLRKSDEQ